MVISGRRAGFVVHGGNESFPLGKDIRAMSLPAMVALAAGSR